MKNHVLFLAAAGIAAVAAQPALADTYSFSAQYFTHNATGDFEQYINGAFTDMVKTALGPTGMRSSIRAMAAAFSLPSPN